MLWQAHQRCILAGLAWCITAWASLLAATKQTSERGRAVPAVSMPAGDTPGAGQSAQQPSSLGTVHPCSGHKMAVDSTWCASDVFRMQQASILLHVPGT